MNQHLVVVREDGTEVAEGDTIINFRGEQMKFIVFTSTRKIYAENPRTGSKHEYYAQVFRLRVVKDGDQKSSMGNE